MTEPGKGVLLSDEKGRTIHATTSLNLQDSIVRERSQLETQPTPTDSLDRKFQNRSNTSLVTGSRAAGGRGGLMAKRHEETFWIVDSSLS